MGKMLNKMCSEKLSSSGNRDPLLTYPYFDEMFKIYTNARAFQLRAVTRREGKLIGLYRIKINDTQQQYTLTYKVQISIIESLKYFRTMVLGQKIII